MSKFQFIPKPIRKVSWMLAFILLLALTAGCGTSEPSATPAPAQTEPVSQPAPNMISSNGVLLPIQQMDLSFGTAGFVETVETGIGEEVAAGQILARLDTADAQLRRQQAEAELAAAQANHDLVAASVSETQRQATITAAALELLAAQQALDEIYANSELSAAEAFQKMVAAQEELNAAQRRLNNLGTTADQTQIDAAFANMILAKADLDDAREAYEPWENKPEANVTRAALLSALAQAEQIYEAAARNYNGLIGSATEIEQAQIEASFALAQARFTEAQSAYETLKDGPDPAALALAEARLVNTQANLDLAEAAGPTQEQLALAQAQVDAARTNLEISQSQIDKMVLVAPYDGVISAIQITPGEWIMSGQMALEILDVSRWRLETKNVSELVIGQVAIGQSAEVQVNAYQNAPLTGTVVAIYPVAVVQQGDTTYTLLIELDTADLKLWPGMTARIGILLDE